LEVEFVPLSKRRAERLMLFAGVSARHVGRFEFSSPRCSRKHTLSSGQGPYGGEQRILAFRWCVSVESGAVVMSIRCRIAERSAAALRVVGHVRQF
jgi:hypothetical protein